MAQARHRLEDRDHLLQTLPPNIGSSFCQERTGIKGLSHLFSSVQSLSHVQLFETPWTAACQASLSITNSLSLLKLMNIDGDAIQPSHPLSSPSPPALNPS